MKKFKVTIFISMPETWFPPAPKDVQFIVLDESVDKIKEKIDHIYNDEYLDGYRIEDLENGHIIVTN